MGSRIIGVLVFLSLLVVAGCGDKSTESNPNKVPSAPANPSPANGAVNQNSNITLAWQASDPDGEPMTYDIYLGTQMNPVLVKADNGQATFATDTLRLDATYYWKIVAKDNHGGETPGPLWSFTVMNFPRGFHVLSVSLPSATGGVIVSGQYTYIGRQGYSLLDVFDIADPYSPFLVGSDSVPNFHMSSTGAIEAVTGQFAFLRCPPEDYQNIEMRIVDISTPSAPNHVATYHASNQNCNIFSLALSGDYAYAGMEATVLEIIDVSNASNPQFVSNIYVPLAFPAATSVSGNYAYVAGHSEPALGNDYQATLWVVDVSNVNQPEIICTDDSLSPDNSSVTDMIIQNDYAYLSVYGGANDGFLVMNIGSPANPLIAGRYPESGSISGIFISNNIAYLTGSFGLHLIDISSPTNPVFIDEWQPDGFAQTCDRCFVMNHDLYITSGGRFIIVRYTP